MVRRKAVGLRMGKVIFFFFTTVVLTGQYVCTSPATGSNF